MKGYSKKGVELIWPKKMSNEHQQLIINLNFNCFRPIEAFHTTEDSKEWRNKLIYGDNMLVLHFLQNDFTGKINLIYIDPPFATGTDYNYEIRVQSKFSHKLKPEQKIEGQAYRDVWRNGLESYLQMMYHRFLLMKKLLAENGTIYVHLDSHVSHYIKVMLDEIFGYERFLGEIIWKRTGARSQSKTINVIHDVILIYTKSKDFVWNQQYLPYNKKYLKTHYRKKDENGRIFQDTSLIAPTKGYEYDWKGVIKKWRVPKYKMDKLEKEERIYYTRKGVARYKRYLDEMPGTPLQSIWKDIPPINSQAHERVQFVTQKPEMLLKRVILTSSNPKDLVADFFCGSGTSLVVAEKLNRKWLGVDQSLYSYSTTKKRLLDINQSKDLITNQKLYKPSLKPFEVFRLGKIEREYWQKRSFKGKSRSKLWNDYVLYILKLYSAEPVTGDSLIHGAKNGEIIHVGEIDSPVTRNKITRILEKCKKLGYSKLTILGWDWEEGLNEIYGLFLKKYNILLKLKTIPNEVLDLSVSKYDNLKFNDLPIVEFDIKVSSPYVSINLMNYIFSKDQIEPNHYNGDLEKTIGWIDYWGVDFDYQGNVFNTMWYSYKSRINNTVDTFCKYRYKKPGSYKLFIKVINVVGTENTELKKVLIESE